MIFQVSLPLHTQTVMRRDEFIQWNWPTLIIINTHGRFAIAFLPLTTGLLMELFEAVFIKKSSG